jgi:hypothetical protein
MKILFAPTATAALFLALAACSGSSTGDDKADPEPRTSQISTSDAAAPSQDPVASPGPTDDDLSDTDLPAGMSDQTRRDSLALMTLELQVALREIDPKLGAPEDVDKAGKQCADLSRGVDDPQETAQRFSSGGHRVTKADGKRINAMLSKRFCP